MRKPRASSAPAQGPESKCFESESFVMVTALVRVCLPLIGLLPPAEVDGSDIELRTGDLTRRKKFSFLTARAHS